MTRGAQTAGRIAARLAVPVALVLLWEAFYRAGTAPGYLAAPSLIAEAIVELSASGELFEHMAASLYRALAGYALGATLGVIAGLGAGVSLVVRGFFEPIVAILYPVPKIAFLPIIILWLGLGHASKIAVIGLSVFFPVFIASFYAVRGVRQRIVWAARSMGAGRVRIFFRVLLPAALPEVFTGLRIGLALSFIVLFAAELLGSRSGLGYLIVIGEDSVRFDLMFAGIATIAVIGFASDRILLAVRRRLLRGQLIGREDRLA